MPVSLAYGHTVTLLWNENRWKTPPWKHFHWFDSCVLICFINFCKKLIDFNCVRSSSAGGSVKIEFRSEADRPFVYSIYCKVCIITWACLSVCAHPNVTLDAVKKQHAGSTFYCSNELTVYIRVKICIHFSSICVNKHMTPNINSIISY